MLKGEVTFSQKWEGKLIPHIFTYLDCAAHRSCDTQPWSENKRAYGPSALLKASMAVKTRPGEDFGWWIAGVVSVWPWSHRDIPANTFQGTKLLRQSKRFSHLLYCCVSIHHNDCNGKRSLVSAAMWLCLLSSKVSQNKEALIIGTFYGPLSCVTRPFTLIEQSSH